MCIDFMLVESYAIGLSSESNALVLGDVMTFMLISALTSMRSLISRLFMIIFNGSQQMKTTLAIKLLVLC